MTSKEYLEQIGKLEHKIKCMRFRSQEYDRLSMSLPSQDFTRERVQTTPNLDAPFVKWISKKADLDRQIELKEKELETLKGEALLKIESLENEDLKNVLVMRYIKYMQLTDVAKELYISLSTAKRWHKDALDLIKI